MLGPTSSESFTIQFIQGLTSRYDPMGKSKPGLVGSF